MSRVALLGLSLAVPSAALACPGHMDGKRTAAADVESDPAACAKKAELVGDACSYTTGMMAQRVLTDGTPWSYTGRLTKFEGDLASHVAAPFTVGPDAVYVVANEVLDELVTSGNDVARVSLEGRRLDIDGVRYFVVTAFNASNS